MSSSVYLFTSQAFNLFLVIAFSVLGSVLGAAEIQTLGKVSSPEDLAQSKFEFHSILRSEKVNKSITLLRSIIEQSQGKPLSPKLERQTGGYRVSQLRGTDIHEQKHSWEPMSG